MSPTSFSPARAAACRLDFRSGRKSGKSRVRRLLLLLAFGLPSAALPAHADTVREARSCGGANGPEQALAACDRLLAASPSDYRYRADIHNSRGVARAMLGDLNGAIDDFNLAIRNWPNHSDAYNNRGFTYAKMGQFSQARDDFEMALSINPENRKARQNLSGLAQIEPQPWGGRDPAWDGVLAQIVGDWGVDHSAMGAGETYTFRPDTTYEHKIWRILPGTRQVAQIEAGTYALQGNRLTLSPQGGGPRAYTWRTGQDPYVGTPMLFLQDAGGTELPFYGSR